MGTLLHSELADNHISHTWEFANEAARLAFGNVMLADKYKMAWQKDNNTFWVLTGIAPIVWTQFGSSAPAGYPWVPENTGFLDEITFTTQEIPGDSLTKQSVNELTAGVFYVELEMVSIDDPQGYITLWLRVRDFSTNGQLAFIVSNIGTTGPHFNSAQGTILGLTIDVDSGELRISENGVAKPAITQSWTAGPSVKLEANFQNSDFLYGGIVNKIHFRHDGELTHYPNDGSIKYQNV